MDICLLEPPQVDERNITVGQAFSFRSADARYFETELDVRAHVKPGVEGRFLEDNDPLAAGPIDKPAIEERLASGRMIETGNDIGQRRLSAAGRPYAGLNWVVGKLDIGKGCVNDCLRQSLQRDRFDLLVHQSLRLFCMLLDPLDRLNVGAYEFLHGVWVIVKEVRADDEHCSRKLTVWPECLFVDEYVTPALLD